MTGGAGGDTFVFGRGGDTITDFQNGQDRIEFDGFAWLHDFGDLAGRIIDVGSDVVIDLGAHDLASRTSSRRGSTRATSSSEYRSGAGLRPAPQSGRRRHRGRCRPILLPGPRFALRTTGRPHLRRGRAKERPMDDTDLLRRIGASDREALKTLYERHSDALHQFLRYRLRDPFDAGDVVQDVFLEIWRAAARFEGRSAPRTWIFGIARNKAVDRMRRGGREVTAPEPDTGIADDAPDPEAVVVAASDAVRLRGCIAAPQRHTPFGDPPCLLRGAALRRDRRHRGRASRHGQDSHHAREAPAAALPRSASA